jgi:hypothetical protein
MSGQDHPQDRADKPMTGRQMYNTLTDTVGGPNLRWRDNLYQALVILACLLIGALVGPLFVDYWLPGVIVGGLIGMVVGLFGSGIFLMIYRAIQHARGKHD